MLSPADLAQLRRQERWSRLLAYPTYALIILWGRWRLGYRFNDLARFRRDVWRQLDAHPGPVIWVANHLTLIDSFLIFWAVFPFSRVGDEKRVPWSTPEYRNYYDLGNPLKSALIRTLLYLCRCIPFLREGDDEASVAWRERAFAKCVAILRNGGGVFVFPEAGRPRSGWLESRRPKDFLGRMALEVPSAKFLCVYLRGEGQDFVTIAPRRGEAFRMHAELVDAVRPGETAARQVSQRMLDKLSELQARWFAEGGPVRNCGGNDVVDLRAPLHQENIDPGTGEADPEWLERHLTPKELAYLSGHPPERRYAVFWKLFAAKEAAHKALARAGIGTPHGAFPMLEVDLFRRKVVHRPTGAQADIRFSEEDADKVHCLAVLRGGFIGDDEAPGDVLSQVEEVPPGERPGEFARRRLTEFIAASSDDIPSPAVLALSEEDGMPVVLRGGRAMDWSVSLSHSGRFVAYSFMIS